MFIKSTNINRVYNCFKWKNNENFIEAFQIQIQIQILIIFLCISTGYQEIKLLLLSILYKKKWKIENLQALTNRTSIF